jgi:hypothetical protein
MGEAKRRIAAGQARYLISWSNRPELGKQWVTEDELNSGACWARLGIDISEKGDGRPSKQEIERYAKITKAQFGIFLAPSMGDNITSLAAFQSKRRPRA